MMPCREETARPIRTALERKVIGSKLIERVGRCDPSAVLAAGRHQDSVLETDPVRQIGQHTTPQFGNGGRFVDSIDEFFSQRHANSPPDHEQFAEAA
jgi:hypothetical protein